MVTPSPSTKSLKRSLQEEFDIIQKSINKERPENVQAKKIYHTDRGDRDVLYGRKKWTDNEISALNDGYIYER
jgi:hypothetical protein